MKSELAYLLQSRLQPNNKPILRRWANVCFAWSVFLAIKSIFWPSNPYWQIVNNEICQNQTQVEESEGVLDQYWEEKKTSDLPLFEPTLDFESFMDFE